jgi:hypothetical protein
MDKDFLIWQLYMCSKGPINISYTMAQYIYMYSTCFLTSPSLPTLVKLHTYTKIYKLKRTGGMKI